MPNLPTPGDMIPGVLGPMIVVFISFAYAMICILIYLAGTRTYYKLKDKKLKMVVAAALCGLITYFIHGALNNFLDIDKIAVPFWGFAAMIVAIELYATENNAVARTEPLSEKQ